MFCLQKMISNCFFNALHEAWNSCPVNFVVGYFDWTKPKHFQTTETEIFMRVPSSSKLFSVCFSQNKFLMFSSSSLSPTPLSLHPSPCFFAPWRSKVTQSKSAPKKWDTSSMADTCFQGCNAAIGYAKMEECYAQISNKVNVSWQYYFLS